MCSLSAFPRLPGDFSPFGRHFLATFSSSSSSSTFFFHHSSSPKQSHCTYRQAHRCYSVLMTLLRKMMMMIDSDCARSPILLSCLFGLFFLVSLSVLVPRRRRRRRRRADAFCSRSSMHFCASRLKSSIIVTRFSNRLRGTRIVSRSLARSARCVRAFSLSLSEVGQS